MKNLYLLLGMMFIMASSIGQNQAGAEQLKSIRELKADLQKRHMEPAPGASFKSNPLKNLKNNRDYGNAPDWNWVEDFGGSGEDFCSNILYDHDGNILLCGSFSGMISVEDSVLHTTGTREAYIAKFNPAGGLIWIKHFPTSAGFGIEVKGIFEDSSGKIYFTGYYSGASHIGGFQLTDNESYDVFLGWMDSDGNVLMAKNLPGTGEESSGMAIQKDDSGNIYILTIPLSKTMTYNINTIICKCDVNGDLTDIYTPGQNIYDFKISGQNIYYFGTILSAGYIGSFYFEQPLYADVFVAKSDTDFNFEWAYAAGHPSSGSSYPKAFYLTADENIYFGGRYTGSISFGEFETDYYLSFMANCDSDGNFHWLSSGDNQIGYDNLNSICGDDEYIYASSSNQNGSDFFLNRIDASNGTLIGSRTSSYSNPCMAFNTATNKVTMGESRDQNISVRQINSDLSDSWLKDFEGNSAFSEVIAMGHDQLGDLYVYGYASNDMDYYGQQIGKGLFLSKQNSFGDLLWIRTLPDGYEDYFAGSYLVTDPLDESVIITGNFYDPLYIPGQDTLTPAEDGSIFIIKYDYNGNFEWARQEDLNAYYLTLATDPESNVLISGQFRTTAEIAGTLLETYGFDDFFIAKYDKDANPEWAIRAGGDDDSDFECFISADASGNIYFAGEMCGSNVLVDDYPLTLADGDGNTVIAKISPDGQVIWAKVKGGSTYPWGDYYSWPLGIHTDADGYSYIRGRYGDSTYFDEYLLVSPYNNFSQYVLKLDPSGNTLWAEPIMQEGNSFDYNQFDVDDEGNVYLGARIHEGAYFGEDYNYECQGYYDIFLAKYNTSGTLNWVKTMAGPETSTNIVFNSVSAYNETTVYAGGTFNNYLVMDDALTLYANNSHGFVGLLGETTWIEVYNKDNRSDLFNLYPNPSSGNFIMEFADLPQEQAEVEITDIRGKALGHYTIPGMQKSVSIRPGQLSPGIYFVKCRTGDRDEVKKLVIR